MGAKPKGGPNRHASLVGNPGTDENLQDALVKGGFPGTEAPRQRGFAGMWAPLGLDGTH